MDVEVIETSELGDRSYIAHDGAAAIVIDPQRDLDRVLDILKLRGLTCRMVLETHVHNDYVTGGFELARHSGATYVMSAHDEVAFERHGVHDGDELTAGGMRVRVIATPGHTDHHVAYAIDDPSADDPPMIFTGGSLLYGSVGRTDLVDVARTEELTRAQYRSARRLAAELPDEATVMPTHGFGSFCSSGSATGGQSSTVGEEKARNDALTDPDEDAFVATLVAGLTAYPAYYAQMAPLNREGPGPVDLSAPTPVEAEELRKRIAAAEWVVDLRNRTAYAADHLSGTIGIALGQQFATYLGWLIPWGSPLTLIGESQQQVTDAQRQLVRIGIDRPAGAAVGSPSDFAEDDDDISSYRAASFEDLFAVESEFDDDVAVLDVRRDDERAGGHLPGSAHIPLSELLARLDDLPAGQLWVHCASGFRASIAASLLQRAGRDVVWIDDDYSAAEAAGKTITCHEPRRTTRATTQRTTS